MNLLRMRTEYTTFHSAPSGPSPHSSRTRAATLPASVGACPIVDCPEASAVWAVYDSSRPDFDSHTFDILNIYHNATYLREELMGFN